MTRSVRRMALGVLAALAFSGCGETEGIGAPQRENAERADAICQTTQVEVGTLADDAAKDRDAVRSAADRFNQLDAPSENETTWLQFVRESENLWLALENVAQARDPSTNERARAEEGVREVRDTNNRLAEHGRKYGMEICDTGLGSNP